MALFSPLGHWEIFFSHSFIGKASKYFGQRIFFFFLNKEFPNLTCSNPTVHLCEETSRLGGCRSRRWGSSQGLSIPLFLWNKTMLGPVHGIFLSTYGSVPPVESPEQALLAFSAPVLRVLAEPTSSPFASGRVPLFLSLKIPKVTSHQCYKYVF